MITVYIATSPNFKKYVGITNNFKRRLKEHGSSKYPFGCAIRKYGKSSFRFDFIECNTLEDALEIEELLIGQEEVDSGRFYNIALGGSPSVHLGVNNPMKNPSIVAKHPCMWTSEFNPMNDLALRQKNSDSQVKRKVKISGVEYEGVNIAARALGYSKQRLMHRLKSPNYPDHLYL